MIEAVRIYYLGKQAVKQLISTIRAVLRFGASPPKGALNASLIICQAINAEAALNDRTGRKMVRGNFLVWHTP